jgi:hypothetical protein
MRKDRFVRFADVNRRTLIVMVALMVPLASLGTASSALGTKEPTGDFARFKQCPRFTKEANLCFYSQITGGEMRLNKLTVPFVTPVTFQGGIFEEEEAPNKENFVAALNGETLSPTPQEIPGGMASLIDCNEIKGKGFLRRAWRRTCRAVFENPRFTRVTEATELARPVSEIFVSKNNEVNAEGIALTMPVRVHLENPLLGKQCYIGSIADPVMFNFTTGTTSPPPPNEPIGGKFGEIEFKDEFLFVEVTEHVQVDNTFPAPEAKGCGGPFSAFVDPLINSKVGLPSPAGYNTIIHSGYSDEAIPNAVVASEVESKVSEKGGGKKWGKGPGMHHWW